MSQPQSQSLLDLSNQLAGAVERGARCIVAVHARPQLASTGVHWRDGLVVTTNGTVRRDRDLAATLPDGKRIGATLQSRDPSTDLAVLGIPAGACGGAWCRSDAQASPMTLMITRLRRCPSHSP